VRQRVIYLPGQTGVSELPALGAPLFSSSDGNVVAVDDTALTRTAEGARPPSLLYFSRAAFDAAVRDLDDERVAEVVAKRRRDFAPRALEESLNWTYERERESLTLAAAAAQDTYFRALAFWTSRVLGEGRYEDAGTAELLVFAAEKQALLRVELSSPEHAPDFDAREVEQHTDALRQLGALLADCGRPEFAEGFPYAETSRVVHVFPLEARVLGQLEQESAPGFAWRDGVLVGRRQRQIEDLRKDGKPAPLLFWDPGWFLQALAELTPAQLERTCDRNARQTPERAEHARREYLNGLRLETLLFSYTLRDHAARQAPAVLGVAEQLVEEETRALARTLARDRSWIDPPSADVVPDLATSEQELCRDLSLFVTLARQGGNAELAERLERFFAGKEAQVRVLTNAPFEPRG